VNPRLTEPIGFEVIDFGCKKRLPRWEQPSSMPSASALHFRGPEAWAILRFTPCSARYGEGWCTVRRFMIVLASTIGLAAGWHFGAEAAGIRISQLYTGGGTISSTVFDADYVELFNSGASPVDISGWLLAYGGSSGTSTFGCAGCTNTIPPGFVIPACGYLLIQVGPRFNGAGAPLPTPDITFSTPALTGAGSIGLLNGGDPSGSCLSGPELQDLLGWGPVTCYQGAHAPTLSPDKALLRLLEGTTATGNNAADFEVGSPTPRNSASPGSPVCLQSPAREGTWGQVKALYR